MDHHPRILRIRPGREEEIARESAERLKRGELVILPTDTVYGLAAHPSVPGARDRIVLAKGREADKPIPLLAADAADVRRYGAELTGPEGELANRFWPGPLTLVLRVKGTTEGFRVPDCAVTRAVLRESGGILLVTSANRSGDPPALTAEEAARCLGSAVTLVLDAGPAPGGTPSTVVRIDHGRPRILREGAVSAGRIEAALRSARGAE
jgi:L-threonylcarbamoyladenylate synthase